jgi:L-rhamnose mutarotase
MLIWRLGTRLFMLMETSDAFDETRDWQRYLESDPRVREWQSLMESLQRPAPGAEHGEWWAEMVPVFELS